MLDLDVRCLVVCVMGFEMGEFFLNENKVVFLS